MHRFAVLCCTHNGEGFLREQLDSLSGQTTPFDEIHVHDWGSTDGTVEIVRGWAATVSGSTRCEIASHSSAPGPALSFLQALRLLLTTSDASHIFFCDQDDRWHDRKAELFAAALRRNPEMAVLFGDVHLIDDLGRRLAESFYRRRGSPYVPVPRGDCPALALVSPAIGMNTCISRSLAERLVQLADGPWPMHDWAALLTASLYELPVGFIEEPTASYRQHSGNLRGAPSTGGLSRRLARIAARRAQVQRLRNWLAKKNGPLSPRVRLLFPGSRVEAVSSALRARNLRLWYRLVLAALLGLSRSDQVR
mgnify:CR=1 FL=1